MDCCVAFRIRTKFTSEIFKSFIDDMKNKNLSTWGHFTVVEYMGELGWEGCADKEILLCSCGLSPPTPGSPRSTSPAKPPPPPPRNPNPPPCPPPARTHATQKALHASSPAVVFQPAKPRRSECLAQPTGNVLIGSA